MNVRRTAGVHNALRRCTSNAYLHMLIVPFRYLWWTLLVPKVATGNCFLAPRGKLDQENLEP